MEFVAPPAAALPPLLFEDEKNEGALKFGKKELGLGNEIVGMEGRALDSRLRASDPTDDDRPCRAPDGKTDDMALGFEAGASAGTSTGVGVGARAGWS